MRPLVTVLIAITIALVSISSATAQGPTIAELKEFSDTARLFFVAGYIAGFGLAAQLPDDRAAVLQRCFADWTNKDVLAIVDSWIVRHPREVADPRHTARVALFSALAEACGWQRRP